MGACRIETDPEDHLDLAEGDWPSEVDLILSAMDVAGARSERRVGSRRIHRVRAFLKLFSDAPGAKPHVLFTRDCHERSIGFLAPKPLPLGYGGQLEITSPRGREMKLHCTLLRCRPTVHGWYECTLNFNAAQPEFRA